MLEIIFKSAVDNNRHETYVKILNGSCAEPQTAIDLVIGLSYERPYLVLALNLILFFVYAVRIPR